MNDNEEILNQCITERRNHPVPEPSHDFADRVLQQVGHDSRPFAHRMRDGFLKFAAVLVAGAVGFLRIEIVLQFLVYSL